MITRGIVEKVIDQHTVKVRLPLIDRVAASETHTNTEDLNTAVMCTLPNCEVNIHVGDVVFVAFEDGGSKNALILGHLYRTEKTDTYCDLILGALKTLGTTQLSSDTYIGQITPMEIKCLKGVTDNVQGQLNELNAMVKYTLEYLGLNDK